MDLNLPNVLPAVFLKVLTVLENENEPVLWNLSRNRKGFSLSIKSPAKRKDVNAFLPIGRRIRKRPFLFRIPIGKRRDRRVLGGIEGAGLPITRKRNLGPVLHPIPPKIPQSQHPQL